MPAQIMTVYCTAISSTHNWVLSSMRMIFYCRDPSPKPPSSSKMLTLFLNRLLSINPFKGSLLVICRSHTKPQASITVNSTPVTTFESFRYLGVTITSNLKWSAHILNTCKSAKQKHDFLYRNFQQADQRTLSQLYKDLILPKLEYCSGVWDPASTTLSDELESVQRLATKLCTTHWSGSSTTLISSLN